MVLLVRVRFLCRGFGSKSWGEKSPFESSYGHLALVTALINHTAQLHGWDVKMMKIFALTMMFPALVFCFILIGIIIAGMLRKELRFLALLFLT